MDQEPPMTSSSSSPSPVKVTVTSMAIGSIDILPSTVSSDSTSETSQQDGDTVKNDNSIVKLEQTGNNQDDNVKLIQMNGLFPGGNGIGTSGATTTSSPTDTEGSYMKQDSVDSSFTEQQVPGLLEQECKTRPPYCPCWTRWTNDFIHHQIPQAVTFIALLAIKKPRWTLCLMAALSLGLMGVGLITNFTVTVEEFEVFAPFGVREREHRSWISTASGFPADDVILATLVHRNGEDIVTMDAIHRVFDAYEVVVQETPGYHEFCAQSTYVYTGTNTCRLSSVLRFWNFSRAIFEATVNTDQELNTVLQQPFFPDGLPVDHEIFLGNHQFLDNPDGTKTITGQCFADAFLFPNVGLEEVRALETRALKALFPVQEEINNNPEKYNHYRLEIQSERSYSDEFLRAMRKDFPLFPALYTIMVLFTMAIYYRRHPVQSRAWLGVGAAITIVCSIMSGFGLMFIAGIPFSNLTMLVPFVIFGVGLDDTFIITGGFARTNPEESIEDRIRQTLQDVGLSISVTTITTCLAFGLGSVSTIPAIRWLCIYSMTTIAVDFIYQITFFICIMVLDAKRIQQNRSAFCVCVTVAGGIDDEKAVHAVSDDESPELLEATTDAPSTQQSNFVDRFIIWYADRLFHPCVKIPVLVIFTAVFACCAYSASLLRQEFQVTELVPDDSYVITFLEAFNGYRARALPVYAYFRFVDHSDPEMQQQMAQYIEDLGNLHQFSPPPFCWVRDAMTITENEAVKDALGLDFELIPFNEQVDILLSHPTMQELYGSHVVRDANGTITASRCRMYSENLNLDVVQEQIDFLHAQEHVTVSQPANQGREDWAFFSHNDFYLTWQFYDAIVQEWVITTIVGIVAVTAVGFFCVPHWSASFIIMPMIAILYVDLVGVIQFSGLYINIVTYVSLAMSIGLLVDYIVHILLRYYESKGATREEKVKETLRTMGSAVLSGGLSTLLGVLPLAFSTSQIMRTVFITFFAMVFVGGSHGLIFLPVLLSYVGPEEVVSTKKAKTTASQQRSSTAPEPTKVDVSDSDASGSEQRLRPERIDSRV